MKLDSVKEISRMNTKRDEIVMVTTALLHPEHEGEPTQEMLEQVRSLQLATAIPSLDMNLTAVLLTLSKTLEQIPRTGEFVITRMINQQLAEGYLTGFEAAIRAVLGMRDIGEEIGPDLVSSLEGFLKRAGE